MLSPTSFVIGDAKGCLYHYEPAGDTWRIAKQIGRHKVSVSGLLLHSTGHLVSGAQDGTLCLWDLVANICCSMIDDEYHDEAIVALEEMPDGRLLVATALTVTVFALEKTQLQELMAYSHGRGTATCMTLLTDGQILLGTSDGSLLFLEEEEWTCAKDKAPSPLRNLHAIMDGDFISVGKDGGIICWKGRDRQIYERTLAWMVEADGSVLLEKEKCIAYGREGELHTFRF